MLSAFLALAIAPQLPERPVVRLMPATATVRIIRGARVHLGPGSRARLVRASIKLEDGRKRPAFLVEFE